MLLTAVAQQVYQEAKPMGLGTLDAASVLLAVEGAANLQINRSGWRPEGIVVSKGDLPMKNH